MASSAADSHLPSACICIHFNAHIEREHVFNGNHGKMNYTDSVSDLMIYVHNTPKQMTGLAQPLKTAGEQSSAGKGAPCAPRSSAQPAAGGRPTDGSPGGPALPGPGRKKGRGGPPPQVRHTPGRPVFTPRRLSRPKNTLGCDARLRVVAFDTHADWLARWPGRGFQK